MKRTAPTTKPRKRTAKKGSRHLGHAAIGPDSSPEVVMATVDEGSGTTELGPTRDELMSQNAQLLMHLETTIDINRRISKALHQATVKCYPLTLVSDVCPSGCIAGI
eukprot:TRINITY_DN764_c0_g1_i2.p1 TRINITY_DN764_c0_g1~~TRINITY_DN764_c0_g1_i2.p1  ORF type:complete len:107 (-),score=12.20 TRINITY_DN764_c0_g1_i2:698-1018(-)